VCCYLDGVGVAVLCCSVQGSPPARVLLEGGAHIHKYPQAAPPPAHCCIVLNSLPTLVLCKVSEQVLVWEW
jgi:hypothetical protein